MDSLISAGCKRYGRVILLSEPELYRYLTPLSLVLAACSTSPSDADPADSAPELDGRDIGLDIEVDGRQPDTEDTSRFDSEPVDAMADTDTDVDANPDVSCDSTDFVCSEGRVVCAGDGALVEACNIAGWDGCVDGQCVSACALAETVDSEFGCEFLAANLPLSGQEEPWVGLTFTNPGPETARGLVLDADGVTIAQAAVPSQRSQTIYVSPPSTGGSLRGSLRSDHGIRIRTDAPMSVVQHGGAIGDLWASADSSLLFPVHALDGPTAVLAWPESVARPVSSLEPSHATATTIVSAADGVRVTIRLTASIAAGDGVPAVRAGEELVVQLDDLQVVHLETAFLGEDFTGTHVEASGPVAVFASARTASVPAPRYVCPGGTPTDPISVRCCADGVFPNPGGICPDGTLGDPAVAVTSNGLQDHLQTQIPPYSLTGTRYVMTPAATARESAVWRIAAAIPSQVQGSTVSNSLLDVGLRRGDFAEYVGDESWTLASTERVVVSALVQSETIAPAFSVIPPTSMYRTHYIVATPVGAPSPTAILALREGADVLGVAACGDRNPAGSIEGVPHEIVRCQLGPGVRLLSSEQPFGGLLCWGSEHSTACHPIGWGPELPQAHYDSDGDGTPDGKDPCLTLSERDDDSDGDGRPDDCDEDSDGDGCPDSAEDAHASDPRDPDSRIASVWVTAAGDDSSSGTEELPVQTLRRAAELACDDTTVRITGSAVAADAVFAESDISIIGSDGATLRVDGHGLVLRSGTFFLDGLGFIDAESVSLTVGYDADAAVSNSDISEASVGIGVAPTGDLQASSLGIQTSGWAFDVRGSARITDVDVQGGRGFLASSSGSVEIVTSTLTDLVGGRTSGVVVESNHGSVELRDVAVRHSTAEVRSGILITEAEAEVSISTSSVVGATAARGTGLFIEGNRASVTVESCDFIDNRSDDHAGVTTRASEGSISLHDIRVLRNEAADVGAGLVCEAALGALDLHHIVVSANSAGRDAGLIVSEAANLQLRNALVSGNRATGGAGARLSGLSAGADVRHLTVSDNQSLLFAPGGLSCEAAAGRAPLVRDSIVGENWIAGANVPVNGCSALYTLANPIVPDLGTNLSGDPNFTGGPNGWYYLADSDGIGSVAVNRGSETATESDLDTRTTSATERPDAGAVDLGYHHPIGPIRPDFLDSDSDGFEDTIDTCVEQFDLYQLPAGCE